MKVSRPAAQGAATLPAAVRRAGLAAALALGLLVTGPACTGGSSTAVTASDIPRIVKEVEPSVVTVQTSNGNGSGVVFHSDGVIVTDVTVLKADRGNLPAAKFSSSLPAVGELAVVICSPPGLEQTRAAGIVSALHRNMPPSQGSPQGLLDLLETDAPFSSGNSGGAVVNNRSEVIGFVTPSTTETDVAEQLLKNGTVRRAVLGIIPTDLSPEIAERFGLPTDSGALVVDVARGGPAEQAGDIITAFDGQKITNVTDLLAAVRKKEPSQQADIVFQRGQDSKTMKVLGATASG